MSDPVPTFSDLSDVYGSETEVAKARFQTLEKAFLERFGSKPELFARSPGRVNLIGEHIDYEGYACLPMALRQDTIVAIRKAGDQLVITNIKSSEYPDYTFSVDPSQKVDADNHAWANYYLAAYKGCFEYLESKGKAPPPAGLQVMVDGIVPLGSGLSSSAAITCSSAFATLAAHGLNAPQGDAATFTAKCEKYVGTESGGMDQAVSIMGKPNTAMLVEFNPVRATDVVLPAGATFVIANSLTVSSKQETGATRYNLRTVECRLAAIALAISLGQPKEEARKLQTLKDVEPLIQSRLSGPKSSISHAAAAAAEQYLQKEPYDQGQIEGLLGASLSSIFEGNKAAGKSIAAAPDVGGFRLQSRALHVFAEADRVLAFRDVCTGDAPGEHKLESLGCIMDESQASCRDLYHCSCAELEALIAVQKKAGALGSRLTGAGWGGCTVSLVREGAVEAFIRAVKDQYFKQCISEGKVAAANLDEVIFASRPASGGAILKLKSLT
ncbi:hypothetical protein WJX74_010258 [Apatococcus lobatus]|uniref:Galactokinase n=1 Tax=Apatococcus lobatus TaxID=904363 RepID=A0AAW1QZB0_9CHLO